MGWELAAAWYTYAGEARRSTRPTAIGFAAALLFYYERFKTLIGAASHVTCRRWHSLRFAERF
jgi:hypothetical protein